MDNQLINIIVLGTAFMILFISSQTTTMISQSVLEGVKNESVNGTGFHGSGYVSQAILQISYAIVNIFVPIMVSIFGPTVSMFLGAATYVLYTISFISPMTWSYFTASILMGFGSAFLWNGQGVYLAVNSNDSTISRNSGIFWALMQTSLLPGNIYVYVALKTEMIDRTTRYSLFSIFSTVAAVSLVFFIILIWRSCIERRHDNLIEKQETKKNTLANVGQTLKTIGKLLKTRNMLLLLILFTYLGLSPAFFVVVYSTCIGHYKKYGDTRKRLIGLHGILIGAGEIIGGGLFGFITKPKTSSQRAFIVIIGFVLQIIYYYSVFINIPSDAPFKETDLKPYIDFSPKTSQVIAFVGSFLIGLGDSGYNTQLMSVLASDYKETAGPAFALFRLAQALAVASTLFYAGFLSTHWQLLIVVTFLFICTLAFFIVLFDKTTNRISTFVPAQENDQGNVNYQYSTTSSIGQ